MNVDIQIHTHTQSIAFLPLMKQNSKWVSNRNNSIQFIYVFIFSFVHRKKKRKSKNSNQIENGKNELF